MLPIEPALSEQLERQEALLAERYPEGTGWLLPSPPSGQRNGKGGAFHLLPVTIRKIVKRYISIAQIRGVDGELVLGVHPHMFRHHVATSMVNEKIPLTVIQKVLDHGSIEMTAHYARLHDETVKQEVWRWHERVNIGGERFALPVDGPLQEAARMKERIARQAGATERLLRLAVGAVMPASERLPELCELPHRRLVSGRARAATRRDAPAA